MQPHPLQSPHGHRSRHLDRDSADYVPAIEACWTPIDQSPPKVTPRCSSANYRGRWLVTVDGPRAKTPRGALSNARPFAAAEKMESAELPGRNGSVTGLVARPTSLPNPMLKLLEPVSRAAVLIGGA